ncbi:MAG TPA: type I restriction-modification enzyme R subunit C-terminal domain-containing protein [Anaerolineales bacterium]|nr:type I restriction-modification enzyme R subunit C-terminal domain-containing protein [Anaerolineales bacterium]
MSETKRFPKALVFADNDLPHRSHADLGAPLTSAEERVDAALRRLLGERILTEPQRKWLGLIRRHMIANLAIARDDFELIEFEQAGATWSRVNKDFGEALPKLLQPLNEAVAI